MVFLTAAQIKTILEGLSYPEPITIVDFVQPESRRKFPSIEVENQGSELRRKTELVQESAQRFLVHVHYRIRASGSNDVAAEKLIEDIIMDGLENATLAGNRIFIEDKEWNRLYPTQPRQNIESTLTVFSTEITSSSGTGIVGAQWSVSLPGLPAMQVLNKPISRDVETTTPYYSDEMVRQGVDYTGETRNFFATVESSTARITTMRALKEAREEFQATLTRDADDEIVTAKLVEIGSGAPYSSLETITFQLEIFPS